MKIINVLVIGIGMLWSSFASAHTEVVVVKMTPDGFEPREITVDVNSTVNFVNVDTEPRWPASNVHPTHEIYSEFDPKKPIEPGNFWLFEPKRVGVWKMHDHLFPHMRGTVTVVAEEGQELDQDSVTKKEQLDQDYDESRKPSFLSRIFSRISRGWDRFTGFFLKKT